MRVEWSDNLVVYGSKKDVEQCVSILNSYPAFTEHNTIAEMRIGLSTMVEAFNLKADILYQGNTIWSRKRILSAIKKVKKNGMGAMTNYLYQFLSLSCGSIAHYNKHGWIDTYPTILALKNFFQRNEFGEKVYDHIPQWKPDVKQIIAAIEMEL